MTCKEALAREGRAALNQLATTFKFCPKAEEPYTVFWDVTAITIYLAAKKAPVEWMEVKTLESWFDEGRIEIDRQHALSERVDPHIPILAINFDDGSLPVDGWHRVYRAIRMGWKTIPTIFLESGQEYRFRYSQPLCDRLREIGENPCVQRLEQMMEKALRQGGTLFLIGG